MEKVNEIEKTYQDIVFHCPELVGIIYDQLPNGIDKMNFKFICKTIYNIINKKISFLQDSVMNYNFLYKREYFIKDVSLKVFINKLSITFDKIEILNEEDIEYLKNIVRNTTGNVKKLELCLKSDSQNWIELCKKLDCFQNIKNVKFKGFYLKPLHLLIFKYNQSLKPHFLTFDCDLSKFFESANIIDEEWFLPKKMKNLDIIWFNENWVKILSNGLVNYSYNDFETLNLFIKTVPEDTSSVTVENILNISKFFKKINVLFKTMVASFGKDEFVRLVNLFTTIDYSSKFRLKIEVKALDIWFSRLNEECYLKKKIESITLYCGSDGYINGTQLMSQLVSTLSRFENLKTIVVDFEIIKKDQIFEHIINETNKNIKNIQIKGCQLLKLNHLKLMAEKFKNIEVLSLHQIQSNDITIIEILHHFPFVKVLEVFFDKSLKSSKILEFFKGTQNEDGHFKFKWPSTVLLNIYTLPPEKDELEELKLIEKNISRKCGQLLFSPEKYYSPNKKELRDIDEKDIWRFAIQHHSECYRYLKVFRNRNFGMKPIFVGCFKNAFNE